MIAAGRACGLGLMAWLLAGCGATGGLAGAVTGTTTAALTGNPALAAAVGIGTKAVTDATVRVASRRWHRVEQDALAAAVGGMGVGETRRWQVDRTLPVGRARGEVKVVQASETPLTACKQVLFTTAIEAEGGPPPRWFLTTACRQADGWRWAAAEPSTERWESLH